MNVWTFWSLLNSLWLLCLVSYMLNSAHHFILPNHFIWFLSKCIEWIRLATEFSLESIVARKYSRISGLLCLEIRNLIALISLQRRKKNAIYALESGKRFSAECASQCSSALPYPPCLLLTWPRQVSVNFIFIFALGSKASKSLLGNDYFDRQDI